MKGEIHISKKYLRKNEFRYNTNPAVKNPRGKGHTVYVSARRGKQYKTNVITHAKAFYGEATTPLKQNPERSKPSGRVSYFSVPRWEQEQFLKNKPKGVWKLSKADRIAIKKFNKKYSRKK